MLIKILSSAAEYLTITEVETPVPPEILESNVNSTLSLLARLWDVLTATWAVIFCALPNTCVKFDSIEYSKLSVPSFLKNIASPPLVVDIPIKSLEIFFIKTVWLSPVKGKLKLAATAVVVPVPHEITLALVGFLNITSWLSKNGWLGIKILFEGTEITFDLSPVVNDFANPMATPAVVPTPTCSSGLKKTISLILDSNGAVIKSISKLSGTVKTGVESVWAAPTTPLLTLKIPLSLNVFKTNKLSVPMPILLPADTTSGILET